MNPAADPLFVAAEVAYRFERDRVPQGPATPSRPRRPTLRWSRQLSRRLVRKHHPARTQRA